MTIGALIPVRMSASRLPRKPLSDVAGKSALERVVDLALRSRTITSVGIATTVDSSDDELAAFVQTRGWKLYRGSVQDVLARMAEASKAWGFDVVVEIDGDDLLCSSEYMDRGVDVLLSKSADLVTFKGLPIGGTPNVVRASALARAVELKTYEDTATGFFRFLTESGKFNVVMPVAGEPAHHHATARMTLDYPQDLEFFRAVYRELDQKPGWSFADVVNLLHVRPDLVALNQGLDEIYRAHFNAGAAAQKVTK